MIKKINETQLKKIINENILKNINEEIGLHDLFNDDNFDYSEYGDENELKLQEEFYHDIWDNLYNIQNEIESINYALEHCETYGLNSDSIEIKSMKKNLELIEQQVNDFFVPENN